MRRSSVRPGLPESIFVVALLATGPGCIPEALKLAPPDDGGTGDEPVSCLSAASNVCVHEPPMGWSGPFAFYSGSAGNVPTCEGSFSHRVLDAHQGLDAGPPSCSPCKCDSPTSLACAGTPKLETYSDLGCSTLCTVSSEALAPTCSTAQVEDCGSGQPRAFRATGIEPTGTCERSGGAATFSPATWGVWVRACGAPAAFPRVDCPSGEVCAPAAKTPFEHNLCVSKPGTQDCPPEYRARIAAYSKIEDTRGCTECRCGGLEDAGPCGWASITAGPACASPPDIVSAVPGSCMPFSNGASYSAVYTSAASITPTGTCPASGGMATGSAEAAGPVTICCAQ